MPKSNGKSTNLLTVPIKATEDNLAIAFAPLSLEEVYALADDPSNGAVVVMSGMVRNQTDGKAVVALGIKLTNQW
jgi:molybdopterin synthase catalytic subunit